jgi:hypothetical protein
VTDEQSHERAERREARARARQAAANASSRKPAREAASRGLRRAGRTGLALLAAGLVGSVLAIIAEFSVLYEIDVVTASCEDLATPQLQDECVTKGNEQHSNALLLMGLLGILLSFGVAIGSRPAAAALLVVGAVILAIAILGDLPDTDETGEIGVNFDRAEASAGIGLTLEIIAGALLAASGVLGLALRGRERP